MKKLPSITVLVPTFNRGHFLAECLDSLLSQTLPAIQILVVNDGCTDHTQKVLKPYQNKIEVLETAQIGKPSAINAGLEKVRGEYLWIFDDDDVALTDALERFVRPLENDSQCGFSYSPFFFTKTQPKNHRLGSVMCELRLPDLKKKGFLIPLLENNFLGGAALFARTSCYQKTGLFDPRLLRSQDYDMAIRIARQFTGIRAPGGATFHYRQHQEDRGNIRDRFVASLRMAKWLEYDQIIFRKLYQELDLKNYLPPNAPLENRCREALLQRLAIMANKLLVPEVLKDLEELSPLVKQSPFSVEEQSLIQIMATLPYYDTGHLLDDPECLEAVRRIPRLRNKMGWAILKECKEKPGLRHIMDSFHYWFQLYTGIQNR